jgi:MerR family mercuric resistance operon transcriptional regulator
MKAMTVGRLAKAAGVHVETIRYYQQRMLLGVPLRPAGGVRRYGPDAIERLRFIRRAQDAGFTLNEIGELMRLSEMPSCRGARALAVRKVEQIEARMADLARIRRELRSLVRQCDAGAERSCAILESFSRAAADPPTRTRPRADPQVRCSPPLRASKARSLP